MDVYGWVPSLFTWNYYNIVNRLKKKKKSVLMSYHIAQGTLFSVMRQPRREGSSGKNQLSLVQFSHSVVSNSLRPHGLQHSRSPCPSPIPGVYSNSRPLSRWCHPTISSPVLPFSFRLQSFPASGSFPVSQFFASGGQSIGASASASVLPMNIQNWFPLGWTGWISLQSKGLSRVMDIYGWIPSLFIWN